MMILNAVHVMPERERAPDLESWELLIAAILAEADELHDADRDELASRVLACGGYAGVDESSAANGRARLAMRLAARLTESR